jgi:hypothetical protein
VAHKPPVPHPRISGMAYRRLIGDAALLATIGLMAAIIAGVL